MARSGTASLSSGSAPAAADLPAEATGAELPWEVASGELSDPLGMCALVSPANRRDNTRCVTASALIHLSISSAKHPPTFSDTLCCPHVRWSASNNQRDWCGRCHRDCHVCWECNRLPSAAISPAGFGFHGSLRRREELEISWLQLWASPHVPRLYM